MAKNYYLKDKPMYLYILLKKYKKKGLGKNKMRKKMKF